jgi:Protein of unknown function (DUF2938)
MAVKVTYNFIETSSPRCVCLLVTAIGLAPRRDPSSEHSLFRSDKPTLWYLHQSDQGGALTGLVSMIGISWGGTEAAAIEAVLVGIIATLATDLWLGLLQVFGIPPANWALVGRWVAWMPRGVFVQRPIAAAPSIRGELAIGLGLSLSDRRCLRGLLPGNNPLGARFRADAHLRTRVRDGAPRRTVVGHATRARNGVLRGGRAAPEPYPHHQYFRACSVRCRALSRRDLAQLRLTRSAELKT